MIKKIITTTTLVAAAAAMANAAEFTFDFKTVAEVAGVDNVNIAENSSAIVTELIGDELIYVSAGSTYGDSSGNANLVRASKRTGASSFDYAGKAAANWILSGFNANTNLGRDANTLTFNFTASESFSISQLDLTVGFFNGGTGALHTNNNTSAYGIDITVGSSEAVALGETVTKTLDGSNSRTDTLSFIGQTAVSVNTGDTVAITIKYDSSTNTGGFIGFDKFVLTTAPIPEPSMFGLLAGLGALVLVGARRRRK